MINVSYAEEYSANGYTGTGQTLAEQATSGTPASDVQTKSASAENVMGAWLLVAGVLIGLMLLAEKFSVGQTYAQVKLGFYNMVAVTILAVLGITLGKVFFAKIKIPGVSALFLAA